MTYSEIESLDAGSWFDTAYGDQTIPTLEQVLLKYKDICHIVIEIKSEEIILIEKLRELLLKLDLLKDQISNSLEIPGVSTYIHPISESTLLTIGFGPGEGGEGLDWSKAWRKMPRIWHRATG